MGRRHQNGLQCLTVYYSVLSTLSVISFLVPRHNVLLMEDCLVVIGGHEWRVWGLYVDITMYMCFTSSLYASAFASHRFGSSLLRCASSINSLRRGVTCCVSRPPGCVDTDDPSSTPSVLVPADYFSSQHTIATSPLIYHSSYLSNATAHPSIYILTSIAVLTYHSYTYTYTHTHTHAYNYTHTHTHNYTHTHTHPISFQPTPSRLKLNQTKPHPLLSPQTTTTQPSLKT